MKQFSILSILFSLVVLASCGKGKATANDNSLEGLKAQLTEKQAAFDKLQTEIRDLQTKILALDSSAAASTKLLVQTMTVPRRDFAHFVEVQGTVVTEDPAFASSETGGRVLKMNVVEGQYVSRGHLIATVDMESLNKQMAELESGISLARDVFTRQENLWKQNIGSEIQYLTAKNNLEGLEKRKESLQFAMTKANVYAPISGTVEKVNTKQGEMSAPGMPIVTLVDYNNLKVKAELPETYIRNIRVGESFNVSLPALGVEVVARVNEIGRTVNPANRTFSIEAALPATPNLKPNLIAMVMVKDQEVKASAVVPTEMIMQDTDGSDFVYLSEGGRAKKTNVERSISYKQFTAIKSGLQGGESLITQGARQATDGNEVMVVGTDTTYVD